MYIYIYIYISTQIFESMSTHMISHQLSKSIPFSTGEVVCCLPCYRWRKRTSQLSTEKRVARTRFVQGQRLKRRSRMRPGAFSRLTITAKVMGLEDYAVYVTLCIYVYMYICIYVYMYICTYVYMYICIYVYMYICIYVYM